MFKKHLPAASLELNKLCALFGTPPGETPPLTLIIKMSKEQRTIYTQRFKASIREQNISMIK
jgi:hypothetical protein